MLLRRGKREKGKKGESSDVEAQKISPSPHFPFSPSWIEKGIVLGCFGGLVGFFTSGLVHYNLGDQEVAMVFFMLMGLGVSIIIKNAKLKMQN